MSDPLMAVLALLVTLGVLVSFHEFGHFWVARRLGVKVLRFSVGFGRPIWSRRGRVDDTEFAVAAIPLGGYVKFLDEREDEVDPAECHRAFNRKPVGSRMAIVAAGPAANFLFAILAYSVIFMVGVEGTRPLLGAPEPGSLAAVSGFQSGDVVVAVDGDPTPTLDEVLLKLVDRSMADAEVALTVEDAAGNRRERLLDLQGTREGVEGGRLLETLGLSLWPVPAVVGGVAPDSPAAQAGLQVDDTVVAIDGEPIRDWEALVERVSQHPGEALELILRDAAGERTVTLVPESTEVDGRIVGRIGIAGKIPEDLAAELTTTVRYGPLQAMLQASIKTWDVSIFTLRMLGRMLVGRASLENISGPLTIAQFAGQSASIGWDRFVDFLALVSISLGVLNLLPVPILDGGHLLYYLIEVVKGRPLSEAAQYFGQRVGIVILLMLMSLAFFNDITRLFG